MTAMPAGHPALQDLDARLHAFEMPASHIHILDTPSEFHESVLSGILNAQHRIFLSSLYIGTDAHDLRSSLRESLLRHPKLTVLILLDKLRGTRPDPGKDDKYTTPVSLLFPLVLEFGPSRVEIRLYSTPELRGAMKHAMPRRLDEGFGLQHTKIYGFDNQVMITGANLAAEYFTDRQDRYYLFSSKELTNYFAKLTVMLAGFCYQLLPVPSDEESPNKGDHSVIKWQASNHLPQPLEETDREELYSTCLRILGPLLWKKGAKCLFNRVTRVDASSEKSGTVTDTIIYPLGQFTPLLGPKQSSNSSFCDTSSQEWALLRLLSLLPWCRSWTFATPYFNMPPWLRQILINSQPCYKQVEDVEGEKESARGSIITASPEAMSFYGARGLAGYIPQAFRRELGYFIHHLINKDRDSPLNPVNVLEWQRNGAHGERRWTFHGKGWWLNGVDEHPLNDVPKTEDLSMTLIGSSNYGERSFNCDLEVDVLIVTRNEDLKRRIQAEEKRILNYGTCWDGSSGKSSILDKIVISVLLWIIKLLGLSI